MTSYFPDKISKKQASDSGKALVLIMLILGLFTVDELYFKVALPLLVMNMIFPMAFKYFAFLWFGLSNILGSIVSKILLGIVYLPLLVPVGLIKRLSGKDPLRLKQFKKSSQSVMVTRNQLFGSDDLVNPY